MTTLMTAPPDVRTSSPAPALAAPQRLLSLDALRGFDMFWILAGGPFVIELAKYTHWNWLDWLAGQLEHPRWHGFAFYDLIFPLFLFISGLTMPLSLVRKIEAGESKSRLYLRVARRALLLIFLGLIVNGLLKFEWPVRFPSVLGRIGLAYMFAAFIVMNFRVRGQIAWFWALLLGYWAAIVFIPVPGYGAGNMTMEGWLGGYVDRLVLPGKLYCSGPKGLFPRGCHDPEGLFATIPAISTALLGALTGAWLLRKRSNGSTESTGAATNRFADGMVKVAGLVVAGVALIWLGKLWDLRFPINKNMWSSSFVLYAGGWSLVFLSVFYGIIDVLGLRRWAFPFVVIGMNPITIYMLARRFIDFDFAAKNLFGGALKHVNPDIRPVLFTFAVLFLEWLFLYFLYRKKVFLRV